MDLNRDNSLLFSILGQAPISATIVALATNVALICQLLSHLKTIFTKLQSLKH